MKKLVIILIFILTLSLFVSCGSPENGGGTENGGETGGGTENGGGDENGGDEVVELIDMRELGYTVVCNMSDNGAFDFAQDIVNAYKEKFDETITKKPQTSSPTQYEIVAGEISSRSETADVALDVYFATTPRVGVGIMRMVGDKLIVNASSPTAYSLLADKLLEYMSGDKFEIPKNLDYVVYYDTIIFDESSTVVTYEEDEINSVSYPASISLDGEPMSEFRTKTFRYELETNFAKGYPEISAEPCVVGATVDIIQPTEENGGVATVTAISLDGKESSTYVINFAMNDFYDIASKIVTKDGKSGTVTIVVDDGQQATAEYVVELGKKYSSTTVSFAVPTKNLGTFTVDTSTNSYVMDEDGRYVYTKNEENWNFWTDLLKDTRYELVSHSHTHSYWGDNDDGGSYNYKTNAGEEKISEVFPKGNVTKELAGSQQMVRDLGQRGLIFIKPGVGARLSQYYFNMLESGLYYIGARTTAYNPTQPSRMLNYRETYKRHNVLAYMVQHYETTEDITKESTAAECVAADVTYWKDYIDSAMENDAWAAFCIHNIAADTYASTHSGHYIYYSQADKLLEYADRRSDHIWYASYTDATIYYNQWSSATVSANAYRDEYIKVNLTHEEFGDCYDMAMTVKLTVPTSWSSAKVNGETLEIGYDDNNQKFVYVDVIPNVELTVEKGSN